MSISDSEVVRTKRPDFHVITTTDELYSPHWPTGTVIQEIHTGDCCPDKRFYDFYQPCDFYQPLWEMAFQCGWARAGEHYGYSINDDEPRLPVRLLWRPEWSDESDVANRGKNSPRFTTRPAS